MSDFLKEDRQQQIKGKRKESAHSRIQRRQEALTLRQRDRYLGQAQESNRRQKTGSIQAGQRQEAGGVR